MVFRYILCFLAFGLFTALSSSSLANSACEELFTESRAQSRTPSRLERGFITIENTQFHYIAKGDPSKPLILFLHGFPEMAIAWREQLEHFSKDHYAVAIDMKGYNLSSKPQNVEAYAIAQLAKEIDAIAASLSDQPYYLVGHDWGAVVAWNVSFRHPERLKGLTVLNGAHSINYYYQWFNNPKHFAGAEYVRKIMSGEWGVDHYAAGNYAEFQEILFNNPIGAVKAFFNAKMRKMYEQYWRMSHSLNAGLNYYRAIKMPSADLFTPANPPHLNPLFNIFHTKVPTLVLWGEKDIYSAVEVNDGLENWLSDFKLIKYPQYSHWILHEAPTEISLQIGKHIAEQNAKAAASN